MSKPDIDNIVISLTAVELADYNPSDWEDCGACLAVAHYPCPYHQGRLDEEKQLRKQVMRDIREAVAKNEATPKTSQYRDGITDGLMRAHRLVEKGTEQ